MTLSCRHRLLVTSGDGPRECRRAVRHVLRKLEKEASARGLLFFAETLQADPKSDPASALVTVSGRDALQFAKTWTGTIQWTCKSPFRPHHRRQNWFVGVYTIPEPEVQKVGLAARHLRIETFRAGGPGGQHQNTTDSGVRITHVASGVSAHSTDERSQHRNRQVALDRLQARFLLLEQEKEARNRSARNLLHRQLERGNPVRVFKESGLSRHVDLCRLARQRLARRKNRQQQNSATFSRQSKSIRRASNTQA